MMKTIKRPAGLLDSWIESQIEHSVDDPNVGFVENLYQTCSVSLIHLWHSRLRFVSHGPHLNTLKKDVANIRLWEENFAAGRLDIILEQSSRLKTNVVENLKGIGEILIYYFMRSDEDVINHQVEGSSFQHLMKELRSLLDNAAIFLSAEEKSDPSSDEDTSDDSSSTTQSEVNRYGRLHSYVVCLMDLVPAIEKYALYLQHRVTQLPHSRDSIIYLSHGAQPFARLITDRFSTATTSLVERLAEANWERSVRIRKQVEQNYGEGELSTGGDRANEDAVTFFKPYSEFHDSGIGTSVFTRSQYAATAVSHKSFLSTADEQGQGHPRVPHLPHEWGKPFKCEYCQKVVTMQDRINWKMHVFADLQSYLCTHVDCKDALKTFTNRDTWARHEINDHFSQSQWHCYKCKIATTTQEDFVDHLTIAHGIALSEHPMKATILSEAEGNILKPDFKDHKCPLCSQSDWNTTKAYATHVARHLEEISLACLPVDEDCYSNVDSEMNTSGNATKNSLPPGNQDHGTLEPREFDYFKDLQDQGHDLTPVYKPTAAAKAVIENGKKKSYRCFKCGTETSTAGGLKRHIQDRHHPMFRFCCPEPGCEDVFIRRDWFTNHCMMRHMWTPAKEWLNLYTQNLICPPQCSVCSLLVSDWNSFYNCFISHCIIESSCSATTGGLEKEKKVIFSESDSFFDFPDHEYPELDLYHSQNVNMPGYTVSSPTRPDNKSDEPSEAPLVMLSEKEKGPIMNANANDVRDNDSTTPKQLQ